MKRNLAVVDDDSPSYYIFKVFLIKFLIYFLNLVFYIESF